MISSAQPGDRVVVKMDPEARAWGRKGPRDGTEGIILGKTRVLRYEGRFGNSRHFYEPGVYERDGSFIVLFDGDEDVTGLSLDEIIAKNTMDGLDYDIQFVDPNLAAQRLAEYHAFSSDYMARQTHFENIVRVGDLPETAFWEGDTVLITNGRFDDEYRQNLHTQITGIEWYWDNRPYRVRWIDPVTGKDAGCGTSYINEADLSLIARGNVWREAHGEPLIFRDIREEAAYASGTGRTEEVRNPANELYSWTKDEALVAIKHNIADGFSLSAGFFGSGTSINVIRFTDRDLGERIRAETLNGFGVE